MVFHVGSETVRESSKMSGDKDLKHCMHKLTESRNMNDICVYCIIKATSNKAI